MPATQNGSSKQRIIRKNKRNQAPNNDLLVREFLDLFLSVSVTRTRRKQEKQIQAINAISIPTLSILLIETKVKSARKGP